MKDEKPKMIDGNERPKMFDGTDFENDKLKNHILAAYEAAYIKIKNATTKETRYISIGMIAELAEMAGLMGIPASALDEISGRYAMYIDEKVIEENNKVPDHVKLQINSERALKNLIGNDPVLEFEIKKGIASSIALQYETVINKNVDVKKLARDVQRVVEESIFVEYRQGYEWKKDLSPEIKRKVDNYVDEKIRSALATNQEYLLTVIDQKVHELVETVNKDLAYRADHIVKQLTDEKYKVMLESQVDARLKEIKEKL